MHLYLKDLKSGENLYTDVGTTTNTLPGVGGLGTITSGHFFFKSPPEL